MMAIGARGVVSVAANLVPEKMVSLGRYCLNGDMKKAMALHLKLFPLVKAPFIETNPIPIKFALSLLGQCREQPRLPLTPLSAEARPSVKRALKNFGIL
jgi:4-hydroxy-tetrahydrodipicolinate synthase